MSDTTPRRDDESFIDINLLPDWYPKLVSRRQRLLAQSIASGAVVFVMMMILVLRQDTVAASHEELTQLEEERRLTEERLFELETQQKRLEILSSQAELIATAGLPLQVTRVLTELEEAMPPGMALKTMSVTTDTRQSASDLSRTSRTSKTPPRAEQVMRFRLTGITRDHNEVETLKPILKKLGFRGEPQPRNVQAVLVNDQTAIEFDIGFEIELSANAYATLGAEGR